MNVRARGLWVADGGHSTRLMSRGVTYNARSEWASATGCAALQVEGGGDQQCVVIVIVRRVLRIF